MTPARRYYMVSTRNELTKDRPHEALPDIARLLELPTRAAGRGTPATGFEPMAIAGNLTQDSLVPYELADGTIEEVPVKPTATYRATGGGGS